MTGVQTCALPIFNALCLESLPRLLDLILKIKELYGREGMNFTLNILRFPSFQSPLVLPYELRTVFQYQLQAWLDKNLQHPELHEYEINHIRRLIDYLDVVKTPHSEAFELDKLRNDFRQFYSQYDQRRNKDFGSVFPELKSWYDSIQI